MRWHPTFKRGKNKKQNLYIAAQEMTGEYKIECKIKPQGGPLYPLDGLKLNRQQ